MKRFLSLALVLVLVCLSESSTEQQVRLALTGNPSEMAVSWTSTADQPYYPVVRAKDEQGRQTEHAGTTRHYSAGEYRSGKFHHVVVKGLIPAKNYSYWCGNMITGEFSREFSFTAAKTRPEKIKLAVVGDLGQTENSVRTAKAILNDPEGIDLILMPGDLSYADGFHPRWDSW